MNKLQHEHATIRAYVVGFVLSLVFTFIPYYLVVNQVITGISLLVTILGFGVLQMLVQIIFFLHIGRGPKPNWNLFFFAATVGTILVVVGGSIVITKNLHYSMAPSDQVKKLVNDEGIYQVNGQETGACKGQHRNHQIMLMDGEIIPIHIDAKQCDTLTFMNHEEASKEVLFGEDSEGATYAGETRFVIREGQNKTITLSELGEYQFHTYLLPETIGSFSVIE